MADLEETLDWADGVYQIEQTDPVVGGPPNLAQGQGIANVQAQQLADRTGWLKAAITALQGVAVVQADIDAAITALRDGAPGALDTLNELAAALGDNDNAMAAIITQLGLKLDATTYTAADILAKIIDEHGQLRSLFLNSLGHVGDGGNDYGLIIKAFEPAITLADRSDNAGSVQMRAHADGALWLLRDVLNDTTIGHSSNTTTKVFVKFTLEGPIFYDNSGAEIGRVTSAGFVGSGASLTDVIPDRLAPTATTVPNLDWDDAVETGMYRATGANNAPFGGWITGRVYAHASAWIIQEAYPSSSSVEADTNTWRREKLNNVWTSWYQTLSSKTEIKALAAATPFTGPAPSAGDFGFSDDFDDIIVGGVYSISGSWVNGPWQAASTSYVATMQVIERQWDAGARFTQIVYEWGRMSQRTGTGDPVSWSDWKRTATVDDLIGYGQSWQDVSASRSVSTSYQNTTGKALEVAVTLQTSQTRYLQTSVDGVTFVNTASCGGFGNAGDTDTASISIPDGHYYRINGSGTISNWAELRA